MRVAYVVAAIVPLTASPGMAFEAHVERLLGQYIAYDDICRGQAGDSTITEYACDSRNEVAMLLNKEGLCYGKKDQAMYQMKWHVCGKGSIK